ncbi:LHFPL tetraspan subfamily member 4 protein [Gadus chalcogrammus]|uniref:LHFPL tetraspan subfamily member 4 protein n=1 Tax=Gadus chalcogrammus TaxID=1042646 RepID=UPI0024C28F52|nr:LHFPL tetraspan subfamily member 4 protein [Gadus chalcogrammus]
MALSPPELYHTEFVRSARAVGVLWGVCTVCLAVLQVVVLVQPAWVVTTETSSSASGTLGLFQVCVEGDWPGPDCQGSPSALAPLPAFQTPAVLVCVSLGAVWTSAACLLLFRVCHSAAVFKSCGWLQLTVGSFQPGNCSVSWVFTLALLGVLDSVILATLAFVLASRQDALLPTETRDQNLLTNP